MKIFAMNGSFSIQPRDNGKITIPIAYPRGYAPNELIAASDKLFLFESICSVIFFFTPLFPAIIKVFYSFKFFKCTIGNKRFGSKLEDPPAWPDFSDSEVLDRIDIAVGAGAANVYTETARIYNPIHSDRAVALAAGLPDIILHGTATLALAVSQIVQRFADNDPEKIKRLGGRFSAMVLMPSRLTLVVHEKTESGVAWSLVTEEGQRAISDGFVCW